MAQIWGPDPDPQAEAAKDSYRKLKKAQRRLNRYEKKAAREDKKNGK